MQDGAGGLAWFAVFYGLDWIATVPPTVRLTSEAFGRENTGVIYGWIGASHQLGASLAAVGAGAIRSVLGDYSVAFWLAGLLCVAAGLSFLTIGRRTFGPVPAQTLRLASVRRSAFQVCPGPEVVRQPRVAVASGFSRKFVEADLQVGLGAWAAGRSAAESLPEQRSRRRPVQRAVILRRTVR